MEKSQQIQKKLVRLSLIHKIYRSLQIKARFDGKSELGSMTCARKCVAYFQAELRNNRRLILRSSRVRCSQTLLVESNGN